MEGFNDVVNMFCSRGPDGLHEFHLDRVHRHVSDREVLLPKQASKNLSVRFAVPRGNPYYDHSVIGSRRLGAYDQFSVLR
jgi:hypothetical protein